ncbi:hypothetical protein ICV36_06050 [Polynucleobacter sp. MWH-UH35A]|nr:hypothetical protein ICV36_06050 [Polynucleobacter sp. MWH-UH35A]
MAVFLPEIGANAQMQNLNPLEFGPVPLKLVKMWICHICLLGLGIT